jgi:hypothetical protein
VNGSHHDSRSFGDWRSLAACRPWALDIIVSRSCVRRTATF